MLKLAKPCRRSKFCKISFGPRLYGKLTSKQAQPKWRKQASKLSQNGAKLTLCGSRPLPDSCRFIGAMVPGRLRSTRATRPAHTRRLPGACAPATQESAVMKSGRPPTTSANIHATRLHIYDAENHCN
jgi:hypothetical protein